MADVRSHPPGMLLLSGLSWYGDSTVDAVDFDRQVRVQAFAFLDQQRATYGDVLPWSVLSEGFVFDGRRVPLIGPQGIFKPGVRRLHQATFRERVLHAYRTSCAICRLRHRELLDAAHILPDGHPRGEPVVPNGLRRLPVLPR